MHQTYWAGVSDKRIYLFAQASGNVAGLCNWAAAMCTYHAVEKDVTPKMSKLRDAEAELKVAEKEKNSALAELAVVQASLDDMQVYHLQNCTLQPLLSQ